jgi:FKBP-type peptidyl-prolyl cis-trans isomerase FkpA
MSAVTAVPIRPLARGAVLKLWIALLLLALAAAGLAWWGTRVWQMNTLDSGVRYRVLAQGSGPTITPADVFALNYRLHVNSIDAPVIEETRTTGRPYVATTSEIFPGFGEALQHMRAGGRYQLWLPPGTHIPRPLGPGAPFTPADTLLFEVEVLQVEAGMASARQMQMLQQMMQQQQGAPPEGANPQSGAPPPPSGGR